jgi:hypothetical protein
MAGNGWRTGNDPTLRALRALAVIGVIGLLIWWAVFDDREDIFVGALLIGFLLAALFGDMGITLPFLSAERRRDLDLTEREDDASRTRMGDEDDEVCR